MTKSTTTGNGNGNGNGKSDAAEVAAIQTRQAAFLLTAEDPRYGVKCMSTNDPDRAAALQAKGWQVVSAVEYAQAQVRMYNAARRATKALG